MGREYTPSGPLASVPPLRGAVWGWGSQRKVNGMFAPFWTSWLRGRGGRAGVRWGRVLRERVWRVADLSVTVPGHAGPRRELVLGSDGCAPFAGERGGKDAERGVSGGMLVQASSCEAVSSSLCLFLGLSGSSSICSGLGASSRPSACGSIHWWVFMLPIGILPVKSGRKVCGAMVPGGAGILRPGGKKGGGSSKGLCEPWVVFWVWLVGVAGTRGGSIKKVFAAGVRLPGPSSRVDASRKGSGVRGGTRSGRVDWTAASGSPSFCVGWVIWVR